MHGREIRRCNTGLWRDAWAAVCLGSRGQIESPRWLGYVQCFQALAGARHREAPGLVQLRPRTSSRFRAATSSRPTPPTRRAVAVSGTSAPASWCHTNTAETAQCSLIPRPFVLPSPQPSEEAVRSGFPRAATSRFHSGNWLMRVKIPLWVRGSGSSLAARKSGVTPTA